MAASPLDYVDPAQVRAGNAGAGSRDADGDGWADDVSWLDFVPGGWLLRQATGNFGGDNANAINAGFEAQDKRWQEAQAAGQAASQSAQAGLDPYAQVGAQSAKMQADLAGVNGPQAQQAALAQLEQSPAFATMLQQSEEAILQNASATGGLRGGNTQQALMMNRPAILSQLLEQQYAALGGLSAAGQNAATSQGQFGMQGAGMLTDVLGQRGAGAAGNIIGQQQARQAGQQQAIQYGTQAIGAGAQIAMGLPPTALGAGGPAQAPQPQGGFYNASAPYSGGNWGSPQQGGF